MISSMIYFAINTTNASRSCKFSINLEETQNQLKTNAIAVMHLDFRMNHKNETHAALIMKSVNDLFKGALPSQEILYILSTLGRMAALQSRKTMVFDRKRATDSQSAF